jgi:hypothetical protein
MPAWLWILAIAAALYPLHCLALWMESRGWIYYVKKQGSRNAVGNAFLEIQSILQPETKHVLEMRDERRVKSDAEGEPKQPGGSGPSSEPERDEQSPVPQEFPEDLN